MNPVFSFRREPRQAKVQRLQEILQALNRLYPKVSLPLHHESPWQLLVATILSAQCTDATVNKVTPALFAEFPTAVALAHANPSRLEQVVHPTGFFHAKAKALLATAQQIAARPAQDVPHTMAELVKLAGVGRKTANVLLSGAEIEGWPGWNPRSPEAGMGIVVDTHVGRVARRLALTLATDPVRVEADLLALVPPNEWATFPLRLIYFGRQICTSRRPDCPNCPLLPLCPAGVHQGETPWLNRSGRAQVAATRTRANEAKGAAKPAAKAKAVAKPAAKAKATTKPTAQAKAAARSAAKAKAVAKSAAKAKAAAKPTAQAKAVARSAAKARAAAKPAAKAKATTRSAAKAKATTKPTAQAKAVAKATAGAEPSATTESSAERPGKSHSAGQLRQATSF